VGRRGAKFIGKRFLVTDGIFEYFRVAVGSLLTRGGGASDIAEPAQAFVAAVLVKSAMPGRVWIVCPDVRSQEDFAAEMAAWCGRVRLFPELEIPAGDALPDPETASERLDLLQTLAKGPGDEVVVIHAGQWESDVPRPQAFVRDVLKLQQGQQIPMSDVVEKLSGAGYEVAAQITARGQIARRGGILDVFAWQASRPVRLEWFDTDIESLRTFDLDSQCSVEPVAACEIFLGASRTKAIGKLRDFLVRGDHVLTIDGEACEGGLTISSGLGDSPLPFYPPPFAELGAGDLVLDEVKRGKFFDQLREWSESGWKIVFACNNEGEGERFRELTEDFHFDASALEFISVPATRGFVCPSLRFALLADAEVLGRSASQRAHRINLRRERLASARGTMDFSEFAEDDFVVHLDHGIGRFLGMQTEPGGSAEVLAVEFANDARLYVPLDQAWQVSRYVGLGRKTPELSELGDSRWQRAKDKAHKGIYDYAVRMLQVLAERETGAGFAFPRDSRWQQEFERSFLFTETVDQVRAIAETKADMESGRPMDRLICGDVGFGKTEVAIRAAFKAVTGGRQAALIAPTTVLAQQHYQTFCERMSEYPIAIELLSRYRSAAEQKRVIARLASGDVDLVIGTHRIISNDVVFKNLGLVIVDEEQRFGVKHKDALKEKFRLVDVLTLSATPIPRTLYLSLMGARDMSLIETPPPNRQPVETIVCGYDERVIRDAIQRELGRGGQVYFLHNRVQTIERTAVRIRELCDPARVIVGHGQMEEKELESVMQAFVGGKADVLVSTTIIESGLDIPNANTIVIDRADRFGLADLYQLRGRVGRSSHKAYAYLLLPRELMSVGAARKRVSAIKQYSELGSGFKIAMRDLEIRGAGNLLGTAQSGHIIAIGFDLYCKLLRRAVDSLKGNRAVGATAILRIDFLRTDEAEFLNSDQSAGAFLPTAYIRESRQRIEAYRRIAEVASRVEVDGLEGSWRDRFGPLPQAATNVLVAAAIRIEASARRITVVEVRGDKLMLTRGGSYILVGGRFPRLTAREPDFILREVLSVLEKMPVR